MENTNRISVIMPVYNAATTLKRSVDSVLGQTCGEIELVLVDDGSTDESPAMIDACAAANPGSVCVLHKENGGLMRAWLDGVRVSDGDYLCFVDSDDWIDAEMIAGMAEQLARDKEGGYRRGQVICCGYLIEYGNRPPREMQNGLPAGVYEGERLQMVLQSELLGHEKRRVIFSRCMKLISRELIEQNEHLLDETIRLGEDVNIMLPVLLDASRVVLMRQPWYHYAFLQDSMVHRYDAGFYDDCVKLRDKLYGILAEKGVIDRAMVRREFLFLFLQTIKCEIRRDDGTGAARRAIGRIRELCKKENARELLAAYPEKLCDPANRLSAFVCKRPNALRILSVRLIFILYALKNR